VSAATPPVLELRNLRVWYGSPRGAVRAVDGVSLQIGPAEVLGLVGDPHPLPTGVLSEARDPGRAASGSGIGRRVGGKLGLGERSDDEDLVAIRVHGGRPAEPIAGDAAGEPALELIG